MKILVVNVNTSETMTGVIAEAARRYASPGTDVVTLTPYFGAEGVDCNFRAIFLLSPLWIASSPTVRRTTLS